jgi:hypothetical protein
MTELLVLPFSELEFPHGIHLLARWQAGDPHARSRLIEIFETTIGGDFDEVFRVPASETSVHVTGSIDLLTLGLMHDLFDLTAAQFYKRDPERYVRSVLMTLKLLGMSKLYLSWPVYGFTAEALGQEMIYSDRFSPGTDPGVALIDADNWHELVTPDLDSGIPAIVAESVAIYHQLTGFRPILHLSAPYSLAADIYGQELLINELTHDRELVDDILDHLVDVVHRPWIEHFFQTHPDGLVELSDASGSPFFIGPHNCRDVAIRATRRLKDENPWGDRVYVANYRGDYVTQASATRTPSRRRGSRQRSNAVPVTLEDLFLAKNGVCSDYVIRLADDRIDTSFYVWKSIERGLPLYLGVGATEIDRNSIGDPERIKDATRAAAMEKVDAIKTVARRISVDGRESTGPPWPGAIYFEDVSAESSFELVEIILASALQRGALVS